MDQSLHDSSYKAAQSRGLTVLPQELLLEISKLLGKEDLLSLRKVSKRLSSIATSIIYSDWTFDVGNCKEDMEWRLQNLPEKFKKSMTGVKMSWTLVVPQANVEPTPTYEEITKTDRFDCWCIPKYEDGRSFQCWYPVNPALREKSRDLLKNMPKNIGNFLERMEEFIKQNGAHLKSLEIYIKGMVDVHARIFERAFARAVIILLNRVLPYVPALNNVAISADLVAMSGYFESLRSGDKWIQVRPELAEIRRMFFPWFAFDRQPYENEITNLVRRHRGRNGSSFHVVVPEILIKDNQDNEAPQINQMLTVMDDGSGQSLNKQMIRNGVMCGPWKLHSLSFSEFSYTIPNHMSRNIPSQLTRLTIVNMSVDLYDLVGIVREKMAGVLVSLELTNVACYKIFPEGPWPEIQRNERLSMAYRLEDQHFHRLFDAITDRAVNLVDLRISEIGYRNYRREYKMGWRLPRLKRKIQPKPKGLPYHRPFYTKNHIDVPIFLSMQNDLVTRRKSLGLPEDPWLTFFGTELAQNELSKLLDFE